MLVNPEWKFILYVMWKRTVLGQPSALQEGSAVGWVTKELSISFWQGNFSLFYKASRQTLEANPASYSVHTQAKVAGPGSKPVNLCLIPGLRTCGAVCAVPPHPSIPHCMVYNEAWQQLYFIWSVFMLMVCLLTAQSVMCTTGGGLPLKITYLFTGNRDRMTFQVMRDDRVVIWNLSYFRLNL